MFRKRYFFLSYITKCVLIADVDRPSEVCQFYDVIDQDYILRLEVSVYYVVAMKVNQCFYCLSYVVGRLDLREEFFLAEAVEEG